MKVSIASYAVLVR